MGVWIHPRDVEVPICRTSTQYHRSLHGGGSRLPHRQVHLDPRVRDGTHSTDEILLQSGYDVGETLWLAQFILIGTGLTYLFEKAGWQMDQMMQLVLTLTIFARVQKILGWVLKTPTAIVIVLFG